jgi:Spy/CpxP family protein refolding chaperone
MRNALTAEQKQKLEEWRREQMQQRGSMRPGMRGPHHGPQGPSRPPEETPL